MARKRKSDEMERPPMPAQHTSPSKPRTGKDFDREWQEFCRKAGIGHYYDDSRPVSGLVQSDEQKLEKIFKRYQFIYWKNIAALRRVELACFQVNANSSQSQIQNIHELLGKPAQELATPQQQRYFDAIPTTLPGSSQDELPSPPSSPSPSARSLRSHFSVSKAQSSSNASKSTDNTARLTRPLGPPPIPPPIPYDSKPTPSSSQSKDTVPKSLITSFYAPIDKSSIIPTTTASFAQPNANTSFAPTAANTSFTTAANTSFWSNVGPSNSQSTAASSFNEDHATVHERKDSSDYLPSVSNNEAADMTARSQIAESSQELKQSGSTDRTVMPPRIMSDRIPASRDSQSTYYGSSLDPQDFERLGGSEAHIQEPDAIPSYQHYDQHQQVPLPGRDERQPRTLRSVRSALQDEDVAMGDAGPEANEGLVDQYKRPRLNPGARDVALHGPRLPAVRSDILFAQLHIPTVLSGLPFGVQWEAVRALQSNIISPEELQDRWMPRTLESLYNIIAQDGLEFRRGFDSRLPISFEHLSIGAKLEWTGSKAESPLKIILQKPQRDISSALQRRFGPENVLYMEMPDLKKPPVCHKSKNVRRLCREFSSRPREFFGRRWICMFVQATKKKGVRNMHRAIWLSVGAGKGSLLQALYWALPFADNRHQRACKAYQRLGLLLSHTIPVTALEPQEISRVEDKKATRDPDDRTFEKPDCRDRFYEKHDASVVMNDGCNEISIWLLAKYAKIKGLTSIPSAIQARVAGSKGVWYVEDEDPRKLINRPSGKLLSISESQAKVLRSLESADDDWRTLNVVGQNGAPKSSFLYTAFLPILINGGVSPDAIREEVGDQVRASTQEFLGALEAEDTLSLRRWMQSNNSVREMKNRTVGIQTIGGFPVGREEKIIHMLQSGFRPRECEGLAEEVRCMAKEVFDLKSKHFRIRLAQSTTLMGIADPIGCLEPGEVHVYFEKAFLDTVTGRSLMMLDGMEGLVARNPALGAWDIQKVRCVFKPELARFRNLIVFPSKGMRPLAGKLQGGDYDGDTFWISWSARLTKPFCNTPAPWESHIPSPESLGITVDRRTLSDMIQDPSSEDQWCQYLASMHERVLDGGMFGTVTLEHEKLVYAQGSSDTPEARILIAIHDYMADADKQGYNYSIQAFRECMKKNKIPTNNPEPAYWEYTRHPHDVTEKEKKEQERNVYPVNLVRVENNIIDNVYMDVVQPLVDDALKRVAEILEPAGLYDEDLVRFNKETWNSTSEDSFIQLELKALAHKLNKLAEAWRLEPKPDYNDAIRKLYADYKNVLPEGLHDPIAIEWLRRQGHGFSPWDLLKASTLARYQHRRSKGRMIFYAAGRELCFLKLNELDPAPCSMLKSYYNAHKLRGAPKLERLPDGFEADEAEGEDGDEDDDGYD